MTVDNNAWDKQARAGRKTVLLRCRSKYRQNGDFVASMGKMTVALRTMIPSSLHIRHPCTQFSVHPVSTPSIFVLCSKSENYKESSELAVYSVPIHKSGLHSFRARLATFVEEKRRSRRISNYFVDIAPNPSALPYRPLSRATSLNSAFTA